MEFDALVLPHLSDLHRAARRWGEDSDDLVQDTLLRARQKWHLFCGDSALPWLLVILRNLAVNRWRRRQRMTTTHYHPPVQPPPFASDPSDVLAAVRDLPPPFRRVIELIELQGKSYRSAARELGVPLGTVMSRLHRARQRLREPLRRVAQVEYGLRA